MILEQPKSMAAMKFLSAELETAFENLKTATELGVPIMAPSPDTGETENAARGPPKPYDCLLYTSPSPRD